MKPIYGLSSLRGVGLHRLDNYDSLRGDGLDFLVLDEYASIARSLDRSATPGARRPEGARCSLARRTASTIFTNWRRAPPRSPIGKRSSSQQPKAAMSRARAEAPQSNSTSALTARSSKPASKTCVGRSLLRFRPRKQRSESEFSHQSALCWSLDFNMNPLCSVLSIQQSPGPYLEEMISRLNTLQACEEF
jgi:hypothetical protein